nr:MAG TPA: hypothetical protein [Crassvirales sp.]
MRSLYLRTEKRNFSGNSSRLSLSHSNHLWFPYTNRDCKRASIRHNDLL